MTDEEFIQIVKTSETMSKAAAEVGIHFNTFKRRAIKLGCYNPNQGSKGAKKEWVSERAIPLQEIFDGKYPQFQTYKLKQRLFNEKIKQNVCDECGISEWNGKQLNCELDHIDGNSKNHSLDNLRILCPNCHSQTSTFRFKRGRMEKLVNSSHLKCDASA